MNPFDRLKPPAGAPDDPMAIQLAMGHGASSEVLDVPQTQDRNPHFDDAGMQRLDYDPDGFYSIPWADGRGDMGPGMENAPPSMEEREALEQAYLQSAIQERDVSRATQEKSAQINIEEERASRRKMGL